MDRIVALLRVFKPNVAIMGYALFLAINATSIWGGVFPFLPMKFQTSELLSLFFVGQSAASAVVFIAGAAASYFFPKTTRMLLVKLTAIPYLLGWCALIASIYLSNHTTPLALVSGCLIGVGSAGFLLLWQRLFASQQPDEGIKNLLVGTMYSAPVYTSLYLLPNVVVTYLIPAVFLPLFGLAIVLQNRAINRNQPMFADVAREHPRTYAGVVRDLWRTAFAAGALAMSTGAMRALTIVDPRVGSYINVLTMIATFIVSISIVVIWQSKSIRLSISQLYRAIFPFIITAFMVLPFAQIGYAQWFAALLYAFYNAATMFMAMQCADISQNRGVNPVFVYGFMCAIVYTFHDLGFFIGGFAKDISSMGLTPIETTALFAVWLLALMYFAGHSGGRRHLRPTAAESMELIALNPEPSRNEHRGAQQDGPSPFRDRISKQVFMLRKSHRLSERETEVLELVARGNSASSIAETLVVSENTVRTHMKRLYAKLDVHKKQEVLALIDELDLDAFDGRLEQD